MVNYGGGGITTPVSVPNGGIGTTSLVAYAPVFGGTTSTNQVQSAASLGTDGMPLSSQGAGAVAAFGPAIAPVFALADAATILVNAALGNYATVTIAGNRTMGAPSNPPASAAQFLEFEITQGSGGSHTIAWTSGAGGYDFGSGSAPTLSTSAGAIDTVAFRWSPTKGQWVFQGAETGF